MKSMLSKGLVFVILIQLLSGLVYRVSAKDELQKTTFKEFLFNVDEGIELTEDGKFVTSKLGSLFHNVSGESIPYMRNIQDGGVLQIVQSVSSVNNNTFRFYKTKKWEDETFDVIDKKVTIEYKFNVTTELNANDLRVGMRLDTGADVAGTIGPYYFEANKEHILKYDLDPLAKVATVTLDGKNIGMYSCKAESMTALTTRLIAQTKSGNDYVADNVILGKEVTWNIDYVKIGYEKDREAKYENIVNIDDKMVSTNMGVAQGTGMIEYLNWVSGSATTSIANETNYIIKQTKGTEYQQRLMITDTKSPYNASPVQSQIDFSKPTIIETKFKIEASTYEKEWIANLKLLIGNGEYTKNDEGNVVRVNEEQYFVNQSDKVGISLKAGSENKWYTVRYEFDPAVKKMYVYVGDSDMPVITQAFSNIPNFAGFTPVVYLKGQPASNNTGDNANLDGATVTWAFDYFRVSQPSTEGVTLLSIDEEMRLSKDIGNGESLLTESGTLKHVNWIAGGQGLALNVGQIDSKNVFTINQTISSIHRQFIVPAAPYSFNVNGELNFYVIAK